MLPQDGIPVILQATLLPILSRKRSLPARAAEHSLRADPAALGWIGERTQGLISIISGQLPEKLVLLHGSENTPVSLGVKSRLGQTAQGNLRRRKHLGTNLREKLAGCLVAEHMHQLFDFDTHSVLPGAGSRCAYSENTGARLLLEHSHQPKKSTKKQRCIRSGVKGCSHEAIKMKFILLYAAAVFWLTG